VCENVRATNPAGLGDEPEGACVKAFEVDALPKKRLRSVMRILIAEDHPDNREMLMRRLERRGYEVHVAENGAEAVEKATQISPDLILMDISMPVMSGIEATRMLRQNPDVAGVKIVALTAHAMDSARRECMDAGCDDFATKPVDFAGLMALIERYRVA
jgi:CheY-like chemotaxis protein